ncbi:MAG TPA: GMC oxidoreductase [Terricaulis sp.]|nr:GMC oxidoreductase [Terricaulis sp.]
MPLTTPAALDSVYDVCVVGAGPAGLACAFDCHDAGLTTLLLEAGGENPVPGEPDILAAEILDEAWHDPTTITSAAALGGSTHWWGGRSIPLDPADFRFWPIAYEDMAPWWDKAADFLGSRSVHESPAPGAFAQLKEFDAVRDECWGPQLNMSRRWRARIRAADGPAILTHARVTALNIEARRVVSVSVRFGGAERSVRAKQFVLTGGGLGVLRLLLLAQRANSALFGGPNGPLGRCYMGHLTGSIAALAPADPNDAQAFACRKLEGGAYARRRLRPSAERAARGDIVNTAFWLDNAGIGDPAHGDAAASAKFIAARIAALGRGEGALGPHIANVARAPVSAAAGLFNALYLLAYAKLSGGHPRATHLIPVKPGAWRLHYHAEQTRDGANRISLSEQTDSLGLPKLKIDFRMREADFEGVMAAHQALDADLRAVGAGALHFDGDRAHSLADIAASARDGYHQLGGASMSADPREGVADAQCRAHDVENLWLAAGAVFASSGQANPTLTIVALARRVAAQLKTRA